MIVDSSALIAILREEAGFEPLFEKLGRAPSVGVGAPTLAETGVVLLRTMGKRARPTLSRFLQEASVTIVPFREEHWPVALDAYSRFGKGHHPAGLNLGDCLTYAIARLSGQPLLCVGDDFSKTDLPLA